MTYCGSIRFDFSHRQRDNPFKQRENKTALKHPIALRDISLCIMTCNRQPSYLDSTLATLFASGPEMYYTKGVTLVVDELDLGFLKKYTCLCESPIRVEPLTVEQSEYCKTAKRIQVRFNVGLYRCLQTGLEHGVLVLEDDVLIKPGALRWMMMALEEMHADGITHYILALNTRGREFVNIPAFRRGEFYTSYPLVSPFYGSQAIFYPPKIAGEFGEYLKRRGMKPDGATDWAGDELLREFLIETSLDQNSGAYATVHAQAEHIGQTSTGLGGLDYWNSKSFYVPNVPARIRIKSPCW